jgi:hypothetical protein
MGVKPIEIRRRMEVQYGDACLSLRTSGHFYKKMRKEVESVSPHITVIAALINASF